MERKLCAYLFPLNHMLKDTNFFLQSEENIKIHFQTKNIPIALRNYQHASCLVSVNSRITRNSAWGAKKTSLIYKQLNILKYA